MPRIRTNALPAVATAAVFALVAGQAAAQEDPPATKSRREILVRGIYGGVPQEILDSGRRLKG